jgi:hypothetical protein
MTTKTILVAALIAILASPAFAAPRAHSRNPAAHSANPAWDVYVGGYYVGSDPDPLVRDLLRREADPPNQ